jgi:hypothetical protein
VRTAPTTPIKRDALRLFISVCVLQDDYSGIPLFGLWWLDRVAALIIASVAGKEGRQAGAGKAFARRAVAGVFLV